MVDSVWLIRHGMRLNFEDPGWAKSAARPHDSPLSETGLQQARETAMFLQDQGIRHMFVSPFYRTLQTASVIAETLDLSLRVEYGFYEWLNPAWTPAFPEIITPEAAFSEFRMIDPAYRSYSGPGYPEEDENVHVYDRVKPAIAGIVRDFDGPVAIVGHGASMHQAARALVDPPTGFLRDMCAINKLERHGGQWRLALSTTAHLSVLGHQPTRFH
ncbi:histidine phosphatase family protein [Cohnella sp. GCM10027633]|uniref:histidine phosphatase family protein n=1 Tax=unclassified Cohnella TaxID=2636738 RepID=UPI00363EA23F